MFHVKHDRYCRRSGVVGIARKVVQIARNVLGSPGDIFTALRIIFNSVAGRPGLSRRADNGQVDLWIAVSPES